MIWHMVSWYDGRMWTEVSGSLWRGDGRRYGEVRILYGKSRKIKRTDLGNLKRHIHAILYNACFTAVFIVLHECKEKWPFLTETRVSAKYDFW